MSTTVTVKSVIDPTRSYQYVDNGSPMRGGMKDVFFSPDKKYVVALFRDPQDFNSQERLKKIATQYREAFFNREGGEYYKNLYCWPEDVIQKDKQIGIVVPAYNHKFLFTRGYFSSDLIKGKDKEGKWFASPKFRNKQFSLRLDDSELGNWLSYLQISVNIARGVKRMHAAGLAHSDLSYKNVLIDPVTRSANIIDIDGLVVPGLFPPDVIGTADFIAPEVLATKHLPLNDPNRKLPRRETDLHALAVLIYMFLLYRHPLKGGKVHDLDTEKDDLLSMGEKALFIEHPTNKENRPKLGQVSKWELPWADVDKLPYTITGPYLKDMFEQAFIKGLHNPQERPPADAWEQALLKTNDLKLECSNKSCEQKFFIYNNTKDTRCPFCGTRYQETIPVLDLFYQFGEGTWKPENQRIVVYNNCTLHSWHADRNVLRNERLTKEEIEPVGFFQKYNGKWILMNQKLKDLKDLTEDKEIAIGEMVELTEGKKLLLSKEKGGRIVVISIANT